MAHAEQDCLLMGGQGHEDPRPGKTMLFNAKKPDAPGFLDLVGSGQGRETGPRAPRPKLLPT